MKRIIKYRAQVNKDYPHLIKKGYWVDGFYYEDLCNGEIKSFIKCSEMHFEVDPDTVCEFTGLLDANRKEIYEGDIFTVNGKYPKLVRYMPEYACFCLANIDQLSQPLSNPWQQVAPGWWNEFGRVIVVIGNEWDTPEMLNMNK